jgi:hypothetical protein
MLCRGCGILTLPAGTRCAQFCASARSEVCSGLYLTSGETGSPPPNLPAVTPGFRLLFNKIEEVISHPQASATRRAVLLLFETDAFRRVGQTWLGPLPRCTDCVSLFAAQKCSQEGRDLKAPNSLQPLLAALESLSERIAEYNEGIEKLAKESDPQCGELIGLTFLLTLEDPYRFRKSRDVGCYLGL